MKNRFQFGVWNLLALVFWLSLWFGAVSALIHTHPSEVGGFGIFVVLCVAPFMAGREIIGRIVSLEMVFMGAILITLGLICFGLFVVILFGAR